jgi:PAS domain S-box-containing protein
MPGKAGSPRVRSVRDAALVTASNIAPVYRAVLDGLDHGVVVHGADGAIVDWNAAALRILDLTEDQLAGRTSLDPRWAAVREDGSPFAGSEHPAMATLADGTPRRDVVMGVRLPDGALRWLSITSMPVREQDQPAGHAVDGVVVVFTEVTELRRGREAMDSLRTLSGLLPICMYCKKVRSDEGYWDQIEEYVAAHSSAVFSHALCPDCLERHFPPELRDASGGAEAE